MWGYHRAQFWVCYFFHYVNDLSTVVKHFQMHMHADDTELATYTFVVMICFLYTACF